MIPNYFVSLPLFASPAKDRDSKDFMKGLCSHHLKGSIQTKAWDLSRERLKSWGQGWGTLATSTPLGEIVGPLLGSSCTIILM